MVVPSPASTHSPLSAARALEVLALLESAGVTGERLHFAGRGPHKPVATNDTNAGKSRNRRVEIYVLPAAAKPSPTEGG